MNNRFSEGPLDLIGNTPLMKLNRMTCDVQADIFAKLEFMNPMGSVKDRIAKYMVEKAEREGKIKPGDTIIDNSSGNTALGLAMVCALKGFHLKIVVRDSISSEKIKFLKALKVEIVMVDSTLPPESPYSYNNLTPTLAKETPNTYYLDQHNNRDNNESHYKTTGPEIWEQMSGKIDYFVAGIGTGGTICGAARFLKEKDSRINQKLVKPSRYLLEGLGDEFLIGCVDFGLIDDVFRITDNDAFYMTRKLATNEGILAGGSSGAAIWASLHLAKRINRPARIVTVFPDSANRYLSTIYNDDWLRKKGFIENLPDRLPK